MSRTMNGPAAVAEFDELCQLYARHAPEVALGSADPADAMAVLGDAVRAHRVLAAQRAARESVIDIQDPTGGAVVVDLVSDESPMLVPSVLAAARRVGCQVRRVIHATVGVRRGDTGELVEVLPSTELAERPASRTLEAWLRLELDPLPAEDSDDLGIELRTVLDAVRDLAEDGGRIARTVAAVADDLAARPGGGSSEPERLLRWLADGRFVFLGYRRDGLAPTGAAASGLGVLRDRPPDRAAPEVGADPEPVVVTRADAPKPGAAPRPPLRRGHRRAPVRRVVHRRGAARTGPGHPGRRAPGRGPPSATRACRWSPTPASGCWR